MNYFRSLHQARKRAALGLVPLAAALLAAGCGSSGSTSTIGPGNENKADNALLSSGATSTPAPPTTTAAVKTPTSGPLSTAPSVHAPGGAAPAKLVIVDQVKGTGAEAREGSTVTVNYTGVLFNGGKEFDSSWKRGEPATFSLGQVIKGWTQGIPGMHVGGRRELIIPAALAYGAKGAGTIPPNAPLVFVIDLLKTS